MHFWGGKACDAHNWLDSQSSMAAIQKETLQKGAIPISCYAIGDSMTNYSMSNLIGFACKVLIRNYQRTLAVVWSVLLPLNYIDDLIASTRSVPVVVVWCQESVVRWCR